MKNLTKKSTGITNNRQLSDLRNEVLPAILKYINSSIAATTTQEFCKKSLCEKISKEIPTLHFGEAEYWGGEFNPNKTWGYRVYIYFSEFSVDFKKYLIGLMTDYERNGFCEENAEILIATEYKNF